MLDVLVTGLSHGEQPLMFPQVRGYYLAKALARSGLRAECRQLPQPSTVCEVLISSEYQYSTAEFEDGLALLLGEIRANRLFCLVDHSLHGRTDHFSRAYCEWFGKSRGVLCREAFDEWVEYGQPHPAYVDAAFSGMFALVPSLAESLGLTLAEAQVAGVCIISSEGQVKDWVLCPEATMFYASGEPLSLVEALSEARLRDPIVFREQAATRFDFRDVAAGTRHAIGL